MRGVALGGFMGTGKTTVGLRLAHDLGLPFVDTDDVLTERHGPPERQILEEGEAVFRAREHLLLAELMEAPEARVIATGGGLWVDPRNRALLRTRCRLVVLTAPLDELARRVGDDPSRPLWDDDVAARHAERQAAYADADLVVETGGATVEAVADEVRRWLEATP